MKKSDFKIGGEFLTTTGRWRCTDIGSRVIVAISLEPRPQVVFTYNNGKLVSAGERMSTEADYRGPPYGVEEVVFDDFEGCEPYLG